MKPQVYDQIQEVVDGLLSLSASYGLYLFGYLLGQGLS